MKILELRFKNLNSLVGEWLIDFSHENFIENGIFAITGPTGAGKTTILDAITLALYGSTARLGKITESSNEIMSRHTGECFSEISFETKKGRYRVNWSQRRSRKKADGKLQTPKHEIVDDLTGNIIEANKLKEVEKVVEAKIGMSFEQFTRSILLAQGSFAAFLQASSDERAPILEQITGTEIYSQISLRVHERRREEQIKLQSLEDQLSSIKLLSDEELIELENSSKEKDLRQAELSQEHKKLTEKSNHLKEIKSLVAEQNKSKSSLQALEKDLNSKAGEMEGIREEQSQIERDLKAFAETKQQNLDLIKNVRELDFKLDEAKRNSDKALSELKQIKFESEKTNQESLNLKTFISQSQTRLNEYQEYFKGALDYELAEQELPLLKNIVDNLTKLEKDSLEMKSKYSSLEQELQKARKEFATVDQVSKNSEQKKNELELELKQLESQKNEILNGEDLNDFKAKFETTGTRKEITLTEKNKLEAIKSLDLLAKDMKVNSDKKALLEELCVQLEKNKEQALKITSLEEERMKLSNGEECPLCGSLEHPYVDKEPDLNYSDSELDLKRKDLDMLNKEHSKFLIETSALEKEIELTNKSLDNLFKRITGFNLDQSFTENIEQLSIKDLENLAVDLKSKINKVETLEKELSLKNKTLRNLEADFLKSLSQRDSIKEKGVKLKSEHSLVSEQVKKQDSELKALEERFDAKFSNFKIKISGDGKIIDKYLSLEKAFKLIQQKKNEAEDLKLRSREAELKLETISSSLVQINERYSKKELECLELERINKDLYSKRIDLFGEGSLADFENELVSAENLLTKKEKDINIAKNNLEKENELLKLNIENIKTRQQELSISLDNLAYSQDLDIEKDLLENEKELNAKFALISSLNQELGIIKEKLESNAKAKDEMKDKLTHLDAQKKELERFSLLHELIGSSDGKKFRNFAQGLSFEIMIAQANIQLEKMTDRYILVRDQKNNLALNILDNYQAGEIRSTKNLSGGESFIVSLALALGLSKMASANVQVDSLFLDEGFGTLDEEALETALSVLSNLKDDGKLIGVISHIPALKDRIPVQIKLQSSSLGRSSISGVGVWRLCGSLV
ncbi:MAG: AAA family ATPase [Candidatus Caenarcaniphilales bacterium]|nr:AAA family ATPase [Candidatus Caenarcaniphilales bacterium]